MLLTSHKSAAVLKKVVLSKFDDAVARFNRRHAGIFVSVVPELSIYELQWTLCEYMHRLHVTRVMILTCFFDVFISHSSVLV